MPSFSTAIQDKIARTRSRHPFLSFLAMQNGDLLAGIVQNTTPKIILFFDFDRIPDESQRRVFLSLGDQWWWGSAQNVPVNYYIGKDFDQFQPYLIGHPKKAIAKIIGPTFSLADIYIKRIKMRRIEIMKRPIAA